MILVYAPEQRFWKDYFSDLTDRYTFEFCERRFDIDIDEVFEEAVDSVVRPLDTRWHTAILEDDLEFYIDEINDEMIAILEDKNFLHGHEDDNELCKEILANSFATFLDCWAEENIREDEEDL